MKKTLSFALTVAVITGCSTSGVNREVWTNFTSQNPTAVPTGRAGAIFFREPNVIAGRAVNVYIGREYLTSLLPGGFQQTSVCPGNQSIYTEFAQQDSAYVRKHSMGANFSLPADSISYFAVVPSSQYGASIQQVTPEIGARAVANLARQNHTLPRVNNQTACTPNPASAQAPATTRLKQYNLEASALFKFDKSDYANMLAKGKAEIKNVAQDMQQYMAQVTRIEVIGHTDPDGSDAYNQRLSQQRANTVKQALVANGVSGGLITPSGMGESQLLIADCEAQYPNNRTTRLACNQPNRRVEINLYGTQQTFAQ